MKKNSRHVCEHTEEGESACSMCSHVRIGAPSHKGVSYRGAPTRCNSRIGRPEGDTRFGTNMTPPTPLALKHAMRANQAERVRAHSIRAAMSVAQSRTPITHGVQHYLYT